MKMMTRIARPLTVLLTGLLLITALPLWAQDDEVEALTATLTSDAAAFDKDVACRRLAVIGTAEAVDALAALLPDEHLSSIARTALELIPGPEATEALGAALTEVTGLQLLGVIESVGSRGDEESVDALADLLESEDAAVATASALALGRIGGSDAGDALIDALEAADPAVRAAVGQGCLACAESLAADDDMKRALRVADAVRRADVPLAVISAATRQSIVWRGDGGVALLLRQLETDEPELYGVTVQLTREMPGERITEAVSDALSGTPAPLRVLLIEALGQRGDPAAQSAVVEAAGADEPEVCIAAIRALAQIGDASAVAALLGAAMAPDEAVANAAANALAALQGEGVDAAVAERLADADPATRAVAIAAAGQRGMTDAVPALIEAASAAGAVRAAAIRALGQTCGPDELPDLADVLVGLTAQEDIALAENAISATASRMEDKQAVANVLTARLAGASDGPKCALLRLLKVAPASSALDAVRASVRDDAGAVQDTAFAVLGDWPSPEAAPDLLALAKAGGDRRDLGLRGYIRLIGSGELAPDAKMAMCNEAAALVQGDGEKDQLLGALATTPTVEALAMVMQHIENAALTNKASYGAVSIAEPLEQSNPTEVVEALAKVLELMDNPNMERRVRASHDRAAQAANK